MQLVKGTAFGLLVCLSIACGMSDEAVKITDDMADEATKLDEQVNEMFAHGRVGGAVIVLVRYANACDDAIAGIEKNGGLRAGEKRRIVRQLRALSASARSRAKSIRELQGVDVRDH